MISEELSEKYVKAKAEYARVQALNNAKQVDLSNTQALYDSTRARIAELSESIFGIEMRVANGVLSATDAKQIKTELQELQAGWDALSGDLAMQKAECNQFERELRIVANHYLWLKGQAATETVNALIKQPITEESLLNTIKAMSLDRPNRRILRGSEDMCSPVFYERFGEALINRLLKTDDNPQGYLPSIADASQYIEAIATGA